MATSTRFNHQHFPVFEQYRIADADIEMEENQFMSAEAEYYRTAKTKLKKFFVGDKAVKHTRSRKAY